MAKVMHDMSHYTECSTLLLRYRNRHKFRLILTIILLIMNFYRQTVTFATKYAGPSIQAVMYASNGEKRVNLVSGMLVIGYMAVFIGIWVLMFKKNVKQKILMIYTMANLVFMAVITILNNITASQSGAANTPGVSHLAFGYGILTLLLSIATIALAFLGEHSRPKLFGALLAVLLLATVTGCYHWAIAIVLLAMNFIAVPEYNKMQWIMKQPGYPYFSERFDEAQANSEYEPMHKLDHRSYGVMEDIDGEPVDAAVIQEKEKEHQEQVREMAAPQMDYTLKVSDDPAEMPGIDDIFEHVEPIPEPEPPKAEDIPDTKWDVPETKWDMPEPNWDVPDVNADIPDLPEIPDIPKL